MRMTLLITLMAIQIPALAGFQPSQASCSRLSELGLDETALCVEFAKKQAELTQLLAKVQPVKRTPNSPTTEPPQLVGLISDPRGITLARIQYAGSVQLIQSGEVIGDGWRLVEVHRQSVTVQQGGRQRVLRIQ